MKNIDIVIVDKKRVHNVWNNGIWYADCEADYRSHSVSKSLAANMLVCSNWKMLNACAYLSLYLCVYFIIRMFLGLAFKTTPNWTSAIIFRQNNMFRAFLFVACFFVQSIYISMRWLFQSWHRLLQQTNVVPIEMNWERTANGWAKAPFLLRAMAVWQMNAKICPLFWLFWSHSRRLDSDCICCVNLMACVQSDSRNRHTHTHTFQIEQYSENGAYQCCNMWMLCYYFSSILIFSDIPTFFASHFRSI